MVRIAMLGWEFPPFISGGLGVHCYELTKALAKKGVEIDFYMPKSEKGARGIKVLKIKCPQGEIELLKQKQGINIIEVGGICADPYSHPQVSREVAEEMQIDGNGDEIYGKDFYSQVMKYNEKCARMVSKVNEHFKYSLIHNHDWLTVKAGVKCRRKLEKPLVFTVHSTEYDRTPVPWREILRIEEEGVRSADRIIAVSNRTREQIIEKIGAQAEKIRVVYNGVNFSQFYSKNKQKRKRPRILFLGRLTEQKGPSQFLHAAKRVVELGNDVEFVIVGTGPLLPKLIDEAYSLGIGEKVKFTGFVSDEHRKLAYSNSDIYVMPSVSEPFGITGLEAMSAGTPVIVSKTSGIGEACAHCLKVDFWDVNKLAEMIIAVLKYDVLSDTLSENALGEVREFSWEKTAEKTLQVYREIVG